MALSGMRGLSVSISDIQNCQNKEAERLRVDKELGNVRNRFKNERVWVKCRPLTEKERGRDIVRVNEGKEVVVLDPDLLKDYLDRIQKRTKEKKYCFDYAFGPESTNLDVYRKSICSVISGVVHSLNATIFAYGSTGSGKNAHDGWDSR